MMRKYRIAWRFLVVAMWFAAGALPATAQCFTPTEGAEVTADSAWFAPEGAFIDIRDQTAAFYILDYSEGWIALHGYADPVAYCETGGDPAWLEMWRLHEVTPPLDQDLAMWLFQEDEAATFVYPLVPVPQGQGLCYIIRNYEPIASGTVRLVVTDNNIGQDPSRRWAAGFHAHGFLEDSDGETVVFNSSWQCSWDVGPTPCGFCAEHIRMNWGGRPAND